MEGEGYPKCRYFSVKTDSWRHKKAHACLIHVRKFRNLVVAGGAGPRMECASVESDLQKRKARGGAECTEIIGVVVA